MTDFQKTFLEMQQRTYSTAKEHGFQEMEGNPLHVPTKLALIMSECAEALEWHRKGQDDMIAHELADVVIRTMDLAESMKIDLGKAIEEKAAFNITREMKHGNKKY